MKKIEKDDTLEYKVSKVSENNSFINLAVGEKRTTNTSTTSNIDECEDGAAAVDNKNDDDKKKKRGEIERTNSSSQNEQQSVVNEDDAKALPTTTPSRQTSIVGAFAIAPGNSPLRRSSTKHLDREYDIEDPRIEEKEDENEHKEEIVINAVDEDEQAVVIEVQQQQRPIHEAEAFAVNEQHLEARMREQIIAQSVTASVVLVNNTYDRDSNEDEYGSNRLRESTSIGKESEDNNANENNRRQSRKLQIRKRKCEAEGDGMRKKFVWFVVLTSFCIFAINMSWFLSGLSGRNEDALASTDGIPTKSPTAKLKSTLDTVFEKKSLRCGILEQYIRNPTTKEPYSTPFFEHELCRAVAAAATGSPDNIEYVFADYGNRFDILSGDSIDLLVVSSTLTMDRDLQRFSIDSSSSGNSIETETGFSFGPTMFYTGIKFGGIPKYVSCADDNLNSLGECEDMKICVGEGTLTFDLLLDQIPERKIVGVSAEQDMQDLFQNGTCTVIATTEYSITLFARFFNNSSNFQIGRSFLIRTPLTLTTRDNDPVWTDFVNWVMQGLIIAEQQNIKQNNATLFHRTELFGEQFADMFVNSIAAVGNYCELYARTNEFIFPRSGWNLLNNGTSGLLFSYPFGSTSTEGPGPIIGGTLDRIIKRRKLHCAIRVNRPGFASSISDVSFYDDDDESDSDNERQGIPSQFPYYVGFDVDFCRGLASSLFDGNADSVVFFPFDQNRKEEGFAMLNNETVDVVAGVSWNLENNIRERTTGQSFSFSQPYFYFDGNNDDDNLCLMTRQDDSQWSSFVFWIVTSIFYAEEHNIYQSSSTGMPMVNLLGPEFRRMLRNTILGVGNYREIYERNISPVSIPRSGRNLINHNNNPGPQLYPPPI